jgi:RNA polymerase sigma factor (TIGR02999 family)
VEEEGRAAARGAATRELLLWASGDRAAAQRLLPLVYQELRGLAGAMFRERRPDPTLQPTALVHEAFVRLIESERVDTRDRMHFRAVAASAMRQILADHARRRRALKRGGGAARVTWAEPPASTASGEPTAVDLVQLDDALERLAALDERQHRIVELRFFAGLEVDEVATVLEVSKSTVEREWRAARAWLGVRLRSA